MEIPAAVANPQLSPEQRADADRLLADIRARIQQLAGGDAALVFAFRRKVAKELNYDERGKPALRRKLKLRLRKKQEGRCADCRAELPERGSVLDRRVAAAGYVEDNVDLICRACDARRQGTRGHS